MGHDSSKVLMGATRNSFKLATPIKGAIEAGYIVRLKSDGTVSIAAADGQAIGISLGKDLSNTDFMSIARAGLEVPVVCDAAFTPAIGAQVFISDTTGKAVASGAGATGMNAIYRTGILTGIGEDGLDKRVALIDFEGGL